jgi:hypothetical protein
MQWPKEGLMSQSVAAVTVSSMSLDSSFPMPFSFHHFIEESPPKQALNLLSICLDIYRFLFLKY